MRKAPSRLWALSEELELSYTLPGGRHIGGIALREGATRYPDGYETL